MKAPSPAFQLYTNDFLSDMNVILMSNQAVGCYIKLICHCWNEGRIPKAPEKIAKLCNEDGSAMILLWQEMSQCFKDDPENPGFLIHPRVEKEREKQVSHREKKAEAGKKGAKSRWNKEYKGNNSDNEESLNNGKCHNFANGKNMAKEIEKEKEIENEDLNNKNSFPGKFPEFWEFAPEEMRVGERDSFEEYFNSVKTEEDHQRLLVALKNYIHHVQTQRAGPHRELKYQFARNWLRDWRDWQKRGPHKFMTPEEIKSQAEKEKAFWQDDLTERADLILGFVEEHPEELGFDLKSDIAGIYEEISKFRILHDHLPIEAGKWVRLCDIFEKNDLREYLEMA